MIEFSQRQIVVLKSGSPQMTVKSVDGDDAICVWFLEDRLRESQFPARSLIAVDITTLSDRHLQEALQGPSPLHIGQIVKLRSGGPQLTVRLIDGSDAVCIWFYGEKLQEKTLPITTLIPVDFEPLAEEQLQEIIRRSNPE